MTIATLNVYVNVIFQCNQFQLAQLKDYKLL